jgi:soluble lytic murein transglycosylase-like protein
MAAESGGRADALSPKGAIGLMQLMPGTAKELGADPFDPAQNVDAGARYLRDLLVKYDGQLWHALAAYNAGPGAVDKYNGVPPYRETVRYVDRIDKAYGKSIE